MPELCEKCHARPAVIHIRAAGLNGEVRAYNLCPPCALAMLAGSDGGDEMTRALQAAVKASGLDLGQLLEGDLLAIAQQVASEAQDKTCPECGHKLSTVREKHVIGCPNCVETFRETIREILGDALEEQKRHRNDSTLMLSQTPEQLRLTLEAQDINRRMEEAVKAERYEHAAALKTRLSLIHQALLKLGRIREHKSDEVLERQAIVAFLKQPGCPYNGPGFDACQPWLPWNAHPAPDKTPLINLSSFVTLTRNLADFPMPPYRGKTLPEAEAVVDEILPVLLEDPLFADAQVINPADLNDHDRTQLYFTRWADTPHFFFGEPGTRLLRSRNYRLAATINDRDHLRITLLGGPMDYQKNIVLLNALERRLQSALVFASDQEFGAVTHDVRDMGSGVNMGCCLHLPALAFEKQGKELAQACRQMGLMLTPLLRDADGDNVGDVFVLRTPFAIGDTLMTKCQRLKRISLALAQHERESRAFLAGTPATRIRLIDRIAKTFATTARARLMNREEVCQAISLLWLGHELGMLPGLNFERLLACYILTTTPSGGGPERLELYYTHNPHLLRLSMYIPEPEE